MARSRSSACRRATPTTFSSRAKCGCTQPAASCRTLAASGPAVTFNFSGNSALGRPGRQHSHVHGRRRLGQGQRVQPRQPSGVWSTAYLGSYGGGLGVTDGSEGSGGNNTHTVDNIGRDNYVLFEFSEIGGRRLGLPRATWSDDSDLTVWIGTLTDPFNNHQTLSDAF